MISLLHSRHLVYDLDFEAQFGRARIAGCAFKANHHELYHLKLNLFEDKVYFVVRNKFQQDSSDFLVLSRLSLPHHFDSEKNHFQIGEGKRTSDGKQIQLYLYDLDRYYAIELNAQDYHFNAIKNKNIKESFSDIIKQNKMDYFCYLHGGTTCGFSFSGIVNDGHSR